MEDYLARHNVETTRYVNLYSKGIGQTILTKIWLSDAYYKGVGFLPNMFTQSQGEYDYSISIDDGVHLDINGLNRSIYIANDIPYNKSSYCSNDLVTDIIKALE